MTEAGSLMLRTLRCEAQQAGSIRSVQREGEETREQEQAWHAAGSGSIAGRQAVFSAVSPAKR